MTLEDLTDVSVGDGPIDTSINMPREKRQEDYNEVTPYNPFVTRPSQTWDDRTMDRMITIKRPAVTVSGELWITDRGFAETLSLMPLSRVDQHMYWKKFKRIQMMQTGELNKRMVDSRQERLMMELVSQKSRLDAVEGGNVNERGAWITNRQLIEQTLRQSLPSRPKGFVESIIDGVSGRK
jgi:hypothetical protein